MLFRRLGQREQHAAAVNRVVRAAKQAGLDQPVHQFDGAVVLDAQALRQLTDGGAGVAGKALDRQ